MRQYCNSTGKMCTLREKIHNWSLLASKPLQCEQKSAKRPVELDGKRMDLEQRESEGSPYWFKKRSDRL